MCTNYKPTSRQTFIESFHAKLDRDANWTDDVYQDYAAPIIRGIAGERVASLATFGMVPKAHMQPGVRISTLNARAETIAQKPSFASAWKAGQTCLIPMKWFYEPNWETGTHERWRIGMQDWSDFAVAGIWREWMAEDGGKSLAFTLITINADEHPLMKRFHRAGDEKRSLVIVPPEDYDDWLNCRDMELARSFLRLYPSELMQAEASPKEGKKAKEKIDDPQGALF
jgi:putative SOS response-associated peptidase YedK